MIPRTGTAFAAPSANAFTHRLVVRSSDIDVLGHASNVRWVQWVVDAAAAHSEAVGLGLEGCRARGIFWVVRRHEIEYLREAKEGDDLEVVTWVDSLRAATSLRRTVFRRTGNDTPLAHAATTWALLSIATGRPTRITAELIAMYGITQPDLREPRKFQE